VTIETREHLDLPIEDRLAIKGLISARPQVGIFLSPAWLGGFFELPPDGVKPLLVILRQGQSLRGFVPLAIRQLRSHAAVSLLGSECGSDRVDLLTAPGFESECADLLVSWLTDTFRSGLVLQLRHVPADSPLWGAIYRTNGSPRMTFLPRDMSVLPYLERRGMAKPLPALERHWRWLGKRGAFQVEVDHGRDAALTSFDALVHFLRDRWKDAGGSALDQPRRQDFHRLVIPKLIEEGYLRMVRLSCGERTIAICYGLATERWWACYLTGYDRKWSGKIQMGSLTFATAIAEAMREGSQEFDFLQGVERVKYLWPVRERVTVDADLYTETFGSQLNRSKRAMRDAAVALAKSTRAVITHGL
jgi:CelD/BcsL family acetyltransferase involved in cellulose biosynthesis